MSIFSKTCVHCGATFQTKRRDTLTCSVLCRVAKHRAPTRKVRVLPADIPKIARKMETQARKARKLARDLQNAEKAAQLAAQPHSGGFLILNRSVTDLCNTLPADYFDWVITDPPYMGEFLPLLSDLSRVCQHVLKPGASLVCLYGGAHLPEVFPRLGECLTYRWQGVLLTPGRSVQVFARKIQCGQKPVLLYSKGVCRGVTSFDVFKSDSPPAREQHVWEQSLPAMLSICKAFVRPGDTVLDPFVGSGTTGIATLALGGKFVGTDIDQAHVNTATLRLAKWQNKDSHDSEKKTSRDDR